MESHKNPSTAVESEKAHSEDTSKRSTPTKKRKHRRKHHHEKKEIDFSVLPGVEKILLSDTAQTTIGAVVGDNVTAEKPWIYIDKELIQEDIDANPETSVFVHMKERIHEFPRQEILFGYIPDESKDEDEFYICITEAATDKVKEVSAKIQRIQDAKLKNAVHKKVKYWESLGSEKEVETLAIRYNRPLIEVEIESKYPILPFKIQFRQKKAQDMRDGYMELRPGDDVLNVIFRRRIDADIQVAPSVKTNEAQTLCTYPSNSYTQYEYEIPPDFALSEECIKVLDDYLTQKMDPFYDLLRVNGTIDLYRNDYEKLILNTMYTTKVKPPDNKEYACFINMDLCGNKMVSNVSFHPMWSGIFVASYVDVASSLYLHSNVKVDEVAKAVYDTHPVLVWGFNDDLKPKLMLETARDIYFLSFCPYDENLVIGGCLNGQIILWDITHKLNRVEEEEILTIKQLKYREYMFSLMDWMKNIFDLSLIRPTAISDLKYSHRGCVVSLMWMSRYHTVTKCGKIEPIGEKDKLTVQFMTAAEDGTVLIWDLLRKPTVTAGGFKAVRKLRRLKKKPSALAVDESPYKSLHLNLKPVYKINIKYTLQNNRILSISSLNALFLHTLYEPANSDSRRCLKLSDRVIFKPIIEKENCFPRKNFYIGTMEGDFLQASWDGQEFDSGEVVNFEDCHFTSFGKYHDGPVVSCQYSHLSNTVLTVGGKVFAIWKEDFLNRPLAWRKAEEIYTFGRWGCFERGTFYLIRIDGYLEVWMLFYKSKAPLLVRLMSNGSISGINIQPRKLKENVFGICDYRGSNNMFYMKHEDPNIIIYKEAQFCAYISREIQRKKEFVDWQNSFNKNYEYLLSLQKVEEKPKEPVFEKETTEKKEKKRKAIVKVYPGQRYLEEAKQQHEAQNQEMIKKIILDKKQLQIDVLLKQREPLMKLEEENEIKRKKQRNKLRESDKIFNDTVAMLFPDIIKAKPIPPPDPYKQGYHDEYKEACFHTYQSLSIDTQDYVEAHPFIYDFNWKNVLKAGRSRRKRLDEGLERAAHYKRYLEIKKERAEELALSQPEEKIIDKPILLDDEETIDFGDEASVKTDEDE